MKRSDYYPPRMPEQVEWLLSFANKLPVYGPAIPLTAGSVTAAVNDARFLAYALGEWINNVRDYAPGCTAALTELQTGTGAAPFDLPVFTAPALPAGVTAVPPGALNRIFKLVQVIKNSAGYTEAMGIDMGIVGSEAQPAPAPAALTLRAESVPGPTGERVKVTFKKIGHTGIALQSRRGTGGVFEDIGIATSSPYQDARHLLVAGVPEIREYRACYWDDGTPSGDWSDVVKVTVSP